MIDSTGSPNPSDSAHVGVVIIGRNEGDNLLRCLASASADVSSIVYVDSGSTDGSQAAATKAGAIVVELESDQPFTAARARNRGFRTLVSKFPQTTYVQFVDGDCELQTGWLDTAVAFLLENDEVAVVCGRRRERFPEATIFNRLIDREWDTPLGETSACGGDALFRVSAFQCVGGYNSTLIAGEEPELCFRLRICGWKVWRIASEMTLHDAKIFRLSQWWKRSRRAGYAYAKWTLMHGSHVERLGVRQACSALFWGTLLPIISMIGAINYTWLAFLFLLWPIQVLRLAVKTGSLTYAFFLVLSKFPESFGVISGVWNHVLRRQERIIEYKEIN